MFGCRMKATCVHVMGRQAEHKGCERPVIADIVHQFFKKVEQNIAPKEILFNL